MWTRRGISLKLTVKSDALFDRRVDNYIVISEEYLDTKGTPDPYAIQFSVNSKQYVYPVLMLPVDKNTACVHANLLTPLELKEDDKISAALLQVHHDEWLAIKAIDIDIIGIHGVLPKKEVDAELLAEALRAALCLTGDNYPLQQDQMLVVPFSRVTVVMKVKKISCEQSRRGSKNKEYFCLSEQSQIRFNSQVNAVELINQSSGNQSGLALSEIPLDFSAKGVGGFKKEIARIIRSVFYTRAMTQAMLDAYGVTTHAKGILLYGPPGTGKTLIAKAISEFFTRENVRIIEGPELKNSFYGATQQNLADMFHDARRNPKKLYVYIFDEIDALFVRRGGDSSVSASNNNDLVTRLTSILDGPESPGNIVVIGTTNRKEIIDPAVLRPGRLDTHIFIGLPSEDERFDILNVHTKGMASVLAKDVDLSVIAAKTKNYTGAELAKVVELARGYAMGKNFMTDNDKLVMRADIKRNDQAEKVMQQHFLMAVAEVKPVHGMDETCIRGVPKHFVPYDSHLQNSIQNFQRCMQSFSLSNRRQLNFLVGGEAGTGKSSLVFHLAMLSGFVYMQTITPEKLMSVPQQDRLDVVRTVFNGAHQSRENAVIILDNIELLLDASSDYNTYSNSLRIMFGEMLKERVGEVDNKLLVIATTENADFLKRIGLLFHFDENETSLAVRLNLQNVNETAAIIYQIAASVDIEFTQSLSKPSPSFINISIRDLIYQLQKFAGRNPGKRSLELQNFLMQLPRQFFTDTKQGVMSVVPQVSSMRSFFK